MKKLTLLAIIMFCCINSFAQSNYYRNFKKMKGEPVEIENTQNPQWHLKNYETLSKQSGYYRYGALGCMAASIGCFAGYASLDTHYNYTFNRNGEITEKKMRKNAKLYLAGGSVLAAAALLCEAISIDCRIRADKSMKIYATGNGAGLAFNF